VLTLAAMFVFLAFNAVIIIADFVIGAIFVALASHADVAFAAYLLATAVFIPAAANGRRAVV
jgi:hypothetical protein